MFDGEGSIGIRKFQSYRNEKKQIYQDGFVVYTSMTNSDIELLDRCVELTSYGSPKIKQRANTIDNRGINQRRDSYGWRLDGNKSIDIIKAIYPYLIAKKKQACIAYTLDILNKSGRSERGNGPVPKESQEKRLYLYELIKRCNQREPIDLPDWIKEPEYETFPGWYLRSDVIWAKCLSGGTVIYAQTQNAEGPMMIKDLVKLDPQTVKLWTGEKWSQVIGWNETPPNPDRKLDSQKRRTHKNRTGEALPLTGELEIHLRSGEKIGCTQDHKFPTQRGLLEAKSLEPGDILQSCSLPEPEYPINPKHLPDTIGWLVGLYLAEGSRSGDTLQISGHINEVERWARLEKLANDYGDHFRFYPTKNGNGANAHIDGKMLLTIIDTYINGKLAKGKHLAPVCWKRSNGFLYQILQGYLDGDGHFETFNNRWRLGFTKNDALAQDLRTLSGRLGFSLRLKRTKHTMNGRKFDGWRGQIRFEQSNHHNTKSDTEIISIEASRARKFWDIAIEDEPHLFALASGVLTHNSNPMPESVRDRPTKAHEYVFLLAKSERYWWDQEAIREPFTDDRMGNPGKYTPHYQIGSDRNDGNQIGENGEWDGSKLGGRNKRTVWSLSSQNFPGAHFAVFPEALVEPCLLAGCPAQVCAECGEPWVRVVEKSTEFHGGSGKAGRTADEVNKNGKWAGKQYGKNIKLGPVVKTKTISFTPTCQCFAPTRPGIVLDPFFGSGTVGVVAEKYKRDWLGIELNPEYIELAKDRIYRTQPALFAR
jgi:hypothetical protein